jgi:UDP-glucuronate 4-epimerase
MRILVTGAAGFIGFHTVSLLIKQNHKVTGIDNFNNYYDVSLKKNRIKEIQSQKGQFILYKTDLRNSSAVDKIIKKNKIEVIIHLAAQAGVRHSLRKPEDYLTNNIIATFNIINLSKINKIKHLILASTSSVYGNQVKMPFKESSSASHPMQFYAATKRSTEIMAHSYSHLFKLPVTILRFFTVYGPWGRPDMALFNFTKKILAKKKIIVFNNGDHLRDFTYVDDVIEGVCNVIKLVPKGDRNATNFCDPSKSDAPFKIYNIGRGKSVKLMDFIREIEKNLGIKAKIKYLGMQPGDIKSTFASTRNLFKDTGFKPKTSIKEGIKKFVDWYKNYYL